MPVIGVLCEYVRHFQVLVTERMRLVQFQLCSRFLRKCKLNVAYIIVQIQCGALHLSLCFLNMLNVIMRRDQSIGKSRVVSYSKTLYKVFGRIGDKPHQSDSTRLVADLSTTRQTISTCQDGQLSRNAFLSDLANRQTDRQTNTGKDMLKVITVIC